jgi:hypothetical protein
MTDKAAIVEAMVASGVPREWIEVHNEPVPIYDYCGKKSQYRFRDSKDQRFADCDKGHIVIRRSHLGSMNNDFALFIDEEKKESIVFLCDYSRRGTKFNDQWLSQITDHYAVKQIEAEHAGRCEQTYTVEHEGKKYIYVRAS